MENRQFVIFNVSEISKIDFTKVLETSENTLRKSVDNTKTFVKWDGDEPIFVSTLTTKEGPYTHEQMSSILSTSDWTSLPSNLT